MFRLFRGSFYCLQKMTLHSGALPVHCSYRDDAPRGAGHVQGESQLDARVRRRHEHGGTDGGGVPLALVQVVLALLGPQEHALCNRTVQWRTLNTTLPILYEQPRTVLTNRYLLAIHTYFWHL